MIRTKHVAIFVNQLMKTQKARQDLKIHPRCFDRHTSTPDNLRVLLSHVLDVLPRVILSWPRRPQLHGNLCRTSYIPPVPPRLHIPGYHSRLKRCTACAKPGSARLFGHLGPDSSTTPDDSNRRLFAIACNGRRLLTCRRPTLGVLRGSRSGQTFRCLHSEGVSLMPSSRLVRHPHTRSQIPPAIITWTGILTGSVPKFAVI